MNNIVDGTNNEPPPVPPTVIPPVVDTLDPDLAAAYRAGIPSIVNAVNSGMTTNAMIVEMVIKNGGGMSNLPPGVQTLVNERRKVMEEEAALENERLKKLAAGVVGMGMMATNIAQGGEYYAEGSDRLRSSSTTYNAGNPPSSAALATMSESQKHDYFSSLANTSVEDYAKLSEPVRQQHIDNVGNEGNKMATEGRHSIDDLPNIMEADKALGETAEQRQAAAQKIIEAADYNKNAEEFHKSLKELTPAEREYALQYRDLLNKAHFGSDASNKANDAQDAKQNGDINKEGKNVIDGADDATQPHIKAARDRDVVNKLNEETARIKAAAENGNKSELAKAALDSTASMIEGKSVTSSTELVSEVATARSENAEIRQQALFGQALATKSFSSVAKVSDGDDFAPGAQAVASAAPPAQASADPRLTINAQSLTVAGMIQPEGIANDVSAEGPVTVAAGPAQRKPQASTGMNA